MKHILKFFIRWNISFQCQHPFYSSHRHTKHKRVTFNSRKAILEIIPQLYGVEFCQWISWCQKRCIGKFVINSLPFEQWCNYFITIFSAFERYFVARLKQTNNAMVVDSFYSFLYYSKDVFEIDPLPIYNCLDFYISK